MNDPSEFDSSWQEHIFIGAFLLVRSFEMPYF